MNKIRNIAIAAAMLVAGTVISFAQTKEHAHGSPHGGIVQTAGDYHVEMVMAKEKMTFYLLDGKEKTLPNKGITGSVILQFADKTSATVTLTAMGDDHFMANNDKASTFKSCVVTFKVNGKIATAKFKAEKSGEKRGEKKAEDHHHNEGGDHQH